MTKIKTALLNVLFVQDIYGRRVLRGWAEVSLITLGAMFAAACFGAGLCAVGTVLDRAACERGGRIVNRPVQYETLSGCYVGLRGPDGRTEFVPVKNWIVWED